jgi:hypothetical protein
MWNLAEKIPRNASGKSATHCLKLCHRSSIVHFVTASRHFPINSDTRVCTRSKNQQLSFPFRQGVAVLWTRAAFFSLAVIKWLACCMMGWCNRVIQAAEHLLLTDHVGFNPSTQSHYRKLIYYLYIHSYMFRSYDHHQAEKYISTLGYYSKILLYFYKYINQR